MVKDINRLITIILLLVCSFGASLCRAQNAANANGETRAIVDDSSSQPSDQAAQDTASDTEDTEKPAESLTLEQLESTRKAVAESDDLAEDVKKGILNVYDKAIADYKLAQELNAAAESFIKRKEKIPDDLRKFKDLLEQDNLAPLEAGPNATIPTLEQKLNEASTALEQARRNMTELENEPQRRLDRIAKIPEESSNAQQQLTQVNEKLQATVSEANDTPQSIANRLLWRAQKIRYENRLKHNKMEQAFYDSAGELLNLQRAYTVRQVNLLEKRVKELQELITAVRKKEAAEAVKKAQAARAETATTQAHPLRQQLAKENEDLAREQSELVDKIAALTKEATSIEKTLNMLNTDYNEIQDLVEDAGGITDVLGVHLLSQRNKLPNLSRHQQSLRQRADDITMAQFKGKEYNRRWRDLIDLNEKSNSILDGYQPPLPDAQRDELQSEVMQLLVNRRDLLNTLVTYWADYSRELARLDTQERELVERTREFKQFINTHILWIKSSDPIWKMPLRTTLEGSRWLLLPENWQQMARSLQKDSVESPGYYVGIFIIFIVLSYYNKRMYKGVVHCSERVRHVYTDSFLHTLNTLILSILLSLRWGLLFLLLGLRISRLSDPTSFTPAMGAGLQCLGGVLLALGLVDRFFLEKGLIKKHFNIESPKASFFSRWLHWYLLLTLPFWLLSSIMQAQQENTEWNEWPGRMAFMAAMIITTILIMTLLHPGGPLLKVYMERHRGGWWERLKYIWYPLAGLIPIIFFGMAGLGYFYGSWYLFHKLIVSLIFAAVIFIIYAMAVRWSIVTQTLLQLKEERRKKLEALKADKEQTEKGADDQRPETTPEPEFSAGLPPGEEQANAIITISRQTLRLLRAVIVLTLFFGLWIIWNDVLPALGGLDAIQLWESSDAQGVVSYITLANIVLILVILIMTIIITRNLPGLLEIAILQRLPLDTGARFAITTISSYIIVTIGIIMIFGELGVGWSKVQWLVAAISVGLGFGLQEIFANFISGLLILFEQPIRVGDIVTIDNVSGVVSRISIRATTITDWDRKEYLVPNKEFITGRLLNWTLTNKINRIVINVGVSYGADVEKALRTLKEVVESHPLIIDDPQPLYTFEGFGDSTLNLVVRCYLPDLDKRLITISELHTSILHAFRKKDIEIAFPQQDIHIRSVEADFPLNLKRNLKNDAE